MEPMMSAATSQAIAPAETLIETKDASTVSAPPHGILLSMRIVGW